LLWILASSSVSAGSPGLALSQIVEISVQNNGDLKSFREEKGLRDAGKIRAGLLPNPTLDFEGSTGALSGNSSENSLSFGISQEFLLAGKRTKRLASAERDLEMYQWQLADRERLLRDEVKSAFYDVVLAESRIILADRAIALNRQLLDVAKERLAAGDIPELEMNFVMVELARSEGFKIAAEKTLNQNHAKLWMLMGLSPEEDPTIDGTLESAQSVTKNLSDLNQLALRQRPDLKALEVEKSRSEADILLAQAESIPNLTAGLAVTRDSTTMEIGGIEGKDTANTIGLKLSMPIPVFDRNQAGVQEARAKRSSTESRFIAATRNVKREVDTAYAGFQNAEKVLTLFKSNIVPQLEENLRLTQEAYRLGEVGILTVIEEQKKFFEVSDGYLKALYDRQTALVKLETAVATELSGGVR
jgi:cobalt-zinc-cadmium efflux system outer membrane protein